jgi:hypothetical protein
MSTFFFPLDEVVFLICLARSDPSEFDPAGQMHTTHFGEMHQTEREWGRRQNNKEDVIPAQAGIHVFLSLFLSLLQEVQHGFPLSRE